MHKRPKLNMPGRILIDLLAVMMIITIGVASTAWARSVRSLGEPTGYVNDYTGTLSRGDFSRLNAICEELERTNETELAIVIVDSTDGRSIESYTQELFETWRIGKSYADNGVLVLIALRDRQWRVHTGYGVEGVLPDRLAARIMENEAVPEFRESRYGSGLIRAATRMKAVLEGESYSGGGFNFNFGIFFLPMLIIAIAGVLIWLAVRVKCPRCGSRVKLILDREILPADYSHSGIRKRDYECTVCHHHFSRMDVIPMLVTSSGSVVGGGSGWGGGWSSGGGLSGGGGGFGGFGGGCSGGGGASGGW